MLVSVLTATIGLAMLVAGIGKMSGGVGRVLVTVLGAALLLVPTVHPIIGVAIGALIVAVAFNLPTLKAAATAGAARSAAVPDDQLLYLRVAAMRY